MIPGRAINVFLLASLVFFFDRLSKIIVIKKLIHLQSVPVLPDIFHFTFVKNTGAAFGLLKDQRLFFIGLTFFVIAFLIIYLSKNRLDNNLIASSFGLILGGTLGNLFDRIKFGYVIDFLDFRIWPVFNIADSCITIGASILIITIISSGYASHHN